MKNRNHGLSEKEMELVQLLMADCESTGDIQAKLKKLFAGTIEQMLEAEMDEHLGYEKNSALGNNSGNSRNGYGKNIHTPPKQKPIIICYYCSSNSFICARISCCLS